MFGSIQKWIKIRYGAFPAASPECRISPSSSFSHPGELRLGKFIHIGPRCYVECKGGVEIGDGSILSSRVTILSSTHDYRSSVSVPYGGPDVLRQVSIGKAVWIGYGAMILPGVRLGDGCIVGAGAVVAKDVDPGCIVAGNPARVVNSRPNDGWRQLITDNQFRLLKKKAQVTE